MLTKIIQEENIRKANELINQSKQICIVTHVSPDGDAVGSSLALYHCFLGIGKQVKVVVPNVFPDFLFWMEGSKEIIIGEKQKEQTEKIFTESDLIFCLDFNALKRIAQLEPLVRDSNAKKIMIDHHLEPEYFCDVTISHPEISSTSELIFRFITSLGDSNLINKTCAESIYTGMMTDTGAFTYNSNKPEIYMIICELLKKGIDKDEIYSNVYNDYSESRLRLQGYILYEKLKIFEKNSTALIVLSQKEKKRFGWKKGDTEGFVNIPLSLQNIVFSVFISEESNMIKLSFRSKGDFPTNQFASEVFGGGGHLNASGGEFYGKLEDAIALFENSLPNYEHLLK